MCIHIYVAYAIAQTHSRKGALDGKILAFTLVGKKTQRRREEEKRKTQGISIILKLNADIKIFVH
jgi:hypothetical protein